MQRHCRPCCLASHVAPVTVSLHGARPKPQAYGATVGIETPQYSTVEEDQDRSPHVTEGLSGLSPLALAPRSHAFGRVPSVYDGFTEA